MSDDIIMYGTDWCGDCHRSRRLLDAHAIPYRFVNIDDHPQAEALVIHINHGRRRVPTLVFADGSTLTEPSDATLAAKLGLPGPS